MSYAYSFIQRGFIKFMIPYLLLDYLKSNFSEDFQLTKIVASNDELNEHDAKLKDMQERNSIEPIWRKF